MKNILVPIDFSDYANNALYIAANIAKLKNAKIHLLHTLGIGNSLLPKEDINIALYSKQAENKLNEFISDKPFLKDLELSYIIKKQLVYKEINATAKEVNADLIVMGSHGSDGIEEILIGSNTQKAVRYADVPLMVVKGKMEGFEIHNAVFACDFELENVKSYENAVNFFKLLDIKLNLVYINTPESFKSTPELNKTLNEFFRNVDADYKMSSEVVKIFNDYDIENGIMTYCKDIDASFIGIPTHGRKGLSHFFSGSIGENLVNHSALPVVTFKI